MREMAAALTAERLIWCCVPSPQSKIHQFEPTCSQGHVRLSQ
jgi:hypothetical protein